MKLVIVFSLFTLLLQSCTCVQMTPEEKEELAERRAEYRAMKTMRRGD